MSWSRVVTLLLLLLLLSWHGMAGGEAFGSKPRGSSADYYSILGVERNCDDKRIKSAYRKLAMQLHPDKGGSEEKFKELVEAYETLSDPQKRSLYDRFGKEGVRGFTSSGSATSGFSTDFRDLFRGFGSSFSMPIMYNLELTLEDFYKGRTVTLMLNGERFAIEVLPGMMEGMEIRGKIKGERGPRDVLFVLQEKSHAIFRRRNADLLMDISLDAAELLLGFEYSFTHLDGKTYTVRSPADETVTLDQLYVVEGLGMPVYTGDRYAMTKGRLFVRPRLSVTRKVTLTAEERSTLRRILGHQRPFATPGSTSVPSPPAHELQRIDAAAFGRIGEQAQEDDGLGFQSFGSFFFR